MEKQTHTRDESAPAGWRFQLKMTVLVLVLIVIGAVVGLFVMSIIDPDPYLAFVHQKAIQIQCVRWGCFGLQCF